MDVSEKIISNQDEYEKIVPINRLTLKDRLSAYKKRPFSLLIMILVSLSTLITAGILGALVIYILVKVFLILMLICLHGSTPQRMHL